jgi:hypothetical protein
LKEIISIFFKQTTLLAEMKKFVESSFFFLIKQVLDLDKTRLSSSRQQGSLFTFYITTANIFSTTIRVR